MTRNPLFNGEITTSDGFGRMLTALVITAQQNGVDVAGAWECRTDGGTPDWEAVITELVKEGGD